MYVYFTTIMHFHLITYIQYPRITSVCIIIISFLAAIQTCAVSICLYNDRMQYKNKVLCCNPYFCMTFATISVYSILSHTPIYTPFLLLFYCAYVADIQWLSVSVINYYNCTISGKWNEVTLLSLLSIGLLVGELGNNWGSKCGCFFILLPSSLSWALLLNSFRIIGCNLLGDSSCMLATGPLVASSSPVGAMVMCVGMVLWRRSRVVGLNTRKQLCSVWWSLRLGFPIRTSKKMKVSFYTDEHSLWVYLPNLLLISAFHRMGYIPFWHGEGKESWVWLEG